MTNKPNFIKAKTIQSLQNAIISLKKLFLLFYIPSKSPLGEEKENFWFINLWQRNKKRMERYNVMLFCLTRDTDVRRKKNLLKWYYFSAQFYRLRVFLFLSSHTRKVITRVSQQLNRLARKKRIFFRPSQNSIIYSIVYCLLLTEIPVIRLNYFMFNIFYDACLYHARNRGVERSARKKL